MQMTLDLSEELATRLAPHEDKISTILEAGLREVSTPSEDGFKGLAEVLEKLAALPTAEEVLALRPSKALEQRARELLEKNRNGGLSLEEEREWSRYEYLEHLVRMAKAKARLKLRNG